MKIDRVLQFFVVKEKKFFPLFEEQIKNLKEAANLLKPLFLEKDPEVQKSHYRKIKALESHGDAITARIYDELGKTFVTPFDREDIHVLAARIDNFLDFIHDAARKRIMYKPKTTHKDLINIMELIEEDAELLEIIIAQLDKLAKKSGEISVLCKRIKEIEHIVDQAYEDFNSYLFENEKDAIELVKHKNIVESLENTTDRARDVADTIHSLIVKLA